MITFAVIGKPQPAGSKKAFVHPTQRRAMVVDANPKAKPWQQQVAGMALEAMGATPMLTGPVGMTLRFYLSRPKSHFGSGRNAGVLKPNAPLWPTTRPDATKLVRAVEDAMTGIVYKDDAQVVAQNVFKHYGDPERVEVTIQPLAARQHGRMGGCEGSGYRLDLWPVGQRLRHYAGSVWEVIGHKPYAGSSHQWMTEYRLRCVSDPHETFAHSNRDRVDTFHGEYMHRHGWQVSGV